MRKKVEFYDTIAADFDQIMNQYDLRRRLEVVFDQLLGGVDLKGCKMLDAGCGTGFFTATALARGAEVTSLDIGVNLLREARKKGAPFVVAGDVANMGFADASFDLIVSSECIEHTPSPRASIKEMARVLRPGGMIVLTCPNRFWYWSCFLANLLKIRPYRGLENWPGWFSLRRWMGQYGLDVRRHRGLHLFPFFFKPAHPVLRLLDKFGGVLGPIYVNQCILAVKRAA